MHVHYGCSKSLFYLNIILSFFVIFRLRFKKKMDLVKHGCCKVKEGDCVSIKSNYFGKEFENTCMN